jgi:thioredoxin-related protein
MKIRNIIFILVLSFTFNACSRIISTYEVFEYNNNWHIGKSHIPNLHKNRKIYSENRYIYIYERESGCIYGFLTNRDDDPEKVIGWIIISGKEYCKDTKSWVLVQ